ncbi:hypothetical protein PTD2_20752 [Pseudoalteromonas tunicata D2]|uniref:Uncharacterized protein n=1 Tax=Pseudoalteromonas tunicata D2 TaxID=87626 RepID=A4CA76_9GAMM|nr:hypothetical protein PTD2_20752 [Pseudoalteromonas tunicata D2]
MVAIAYELARFVWHLLQKNVAYQPQTMQA